MLVTLSLVVFCVGHLSAEKTQIQLEPDKVALILTGVMPCLIETPLDPDVIMQLRSGNRPKNLDEKKLHKFIYCAFTKTGYGKKNGHVKVDKALELYPSTVDKDKLKKVMEECNKKEGKDPMETAGLFMRCFKAESPYKIVL